MHPRISINTISSLTWPLVDDLALLDRLGATRLGFPLLKIENDVESGVEEIRQTGIEVACVAASTAEASLLDPEDALEALRPAIDVADALGSPLCYFTSGRTPERMSTDDAFAALVAALPPSVAYAADRATASPTATSASSTRSPMQSSWPGRPTSRSASSCRIAGTSVTSLACSVITSRTSASSRSATSGSARSCG
jgi:hypothetical protein